MLMRLSTAVALSMLFAVSLQAQAPSRGTSQGFVHFRIAGQGCELAGVPHGTITTTYWRLFDQTELCVRLTAGDAPSPALLYFIAVFAGRDLSRPPGTILLRAHVPTIVGAGRIRSSLLRLQADGLDLAGDGRQYELTTACAFSPDSCPFDGIVSLIQLEELRSLASATHFEITALTVPFTIDSADVVTIREFAKAIGILD